jgi:hypothetical protein
MGFDGDSNSGDMPEWYESWHDNPASEGHDSADQQDSYGGIDPDLLPPSSAECIEIDDNTLPGPKSVEAVVDTTPEAIYARIMDEVTQGVTEEHSRDTPLDIVVAGLTIEAADADDIAAVEKYVEVMKGLYGISDAIRTIAYCAGARVGSVPTVELLNNTLAQEKTQALNSILSWRSDPKRFYIDPHYEQTALFNVANALAAHYIPPDVWINNYALDDEHHWTVTVAHHRHMAGLEKGDQSLHKTALNIKIAELADNPMYDGLFVYGQTYQALGMTDDPAVRARLVDRFIEAGGAVLLNLETFEKIISVGECLMRDADPAVATPGRVEYFESTVAHCVASTQILSMPAADVARNLVRWNAAIARYHGADASTIVSVIDAQTRIALEVATTDDETDQKTALDSRDNTLRDYARDYATRNDFVAVSVVLAAVANDITRRYVMSDCLGKARTPEQVAAVRPDDMTLAFDPGMQLEFQLADVRVSGDVEMIAAVGLECARTPHAGIDLMRPTFINDAYAALAGLDKPHALGFAREALAAMRENYYQYRDMQPLSEALIAAGDPDEPQLAYDAIAAIPSSPDRLHYLWQLAHKIAGKEVPIL